MSSFFIAERSSYMSLDQAIEHALDVASETDCVNCKTEYLQLAAWLQELQEYRKRDGKYD